jgi:hypothetical protein
VLLDRNKKINLDELKNVISYFKKDLNDEELNTLCEDIIIHTTNGDSEIGEAGKFILKT